MSTVMTLAAPPKILTYESYMAEEESNLRYDILDGERIFMTPTGEHQYILLNLAILFRAYEQTARQGKVIIAPHDVLITRVPLRTRQPDVFFISNERNTLNPALTDPSPLTTAQELVVEIISGSETERRFNAKVKDYCKVDVKECWKIQGEARTVEVLHLSRTGTESVRFTVWARLSNLSRFPD